MSDQLPMLVPMDEETTEDGCPACGENRIDELAWIDDETVRCLTCGREYRL